MLSLDTTSNVQFDFATIQQLNLVHKSPYTQAMNLPLEFNSHLVTVS